MESLKMKNNKRIIYLIFVSIIFKNVSSINLELFSFIFSKSFFIY